MQPDPSDAPHPTPHAPDDAPRRHAYPAATWDLARRDYLDGDPAELVCDRYGMSVSTLRDRARREKWRLCDQPEPDSASVPDEDPEGDAPVDCAALAGDALVRVRRALRRGRAAEAASWMRLHDRLTARLEAQREAATRRDRVERGRGSAGASDPLERALRPLRHRMAIVADAANLQMRLSAAYRRGQLGELQLDRFMDLNFDTLQALRALTDPPETDDAPVEAPLEAAAAVDPHCTHPLFSVSDDP